MGFSRSLARWFPTPRLLMPRAAGVDITDGSVKWLMFLHDAEGSRVAQFGYRALPEGVVENGAVKDPKALGDALKEVRQKLGRGIQAHAALPEEGAFVFDMRVPSGGTREAMLPLVEFELEGRVPVPVSEMVYDFDVISRSRDGSVEMGVTAFTRAIADGYAEAFARSGMTLASLEIEARSIARAVSDPEGGDPVTLLADVGKARTGFAILKHGVPVFTSTVEVGGEHMSRAAMEALLISEEDAEKFKNEQGLVATGAGVEKARAALEHAATALRDEVEKHCRFWETRRDEHGERMPPVERVFLVGGGANLRGLTDFIAGKVHVRTERPNVWRNVARFDDSIPPIDRRTSLQYATVVGLALRGIV